ncbi:MAG: hypothetical protein WCO66_00795 [Candidatus Absconditabacteria bacterium]
MNTLERLIIDQIKEDSKSLQSVVNRIYRESIAPTLVLVGKIQKAAEALQESGKDWNKITKLGVATIKEKCENIVKLIENLPDKDGSYGQDEYMPIFSEALRITDFADALRDFGFNQK